MKFGRAFRLAWSLALGQGNISLDSIRYLDSNNCIRAYIKRSRHQPGPRFAPSFEGLMLPSRDRGRRRRELENKCGSLPLFANEKSAGTSGN